MLLCPPTFPCRLDSVFDSVFVSVQSAPELARLLGESIDAEQTALFETHNKTGTSSRGPGYSVQGGGSHATSPDNPALAAEEELTEEDELVSPA